MIGSTKTEGMARDRPEQVSTTHGDVVAAIEYLTKQSGWSHELTITPAGDRWLP